MNSSPFSFARNGCTTPLSESKASRRYNIFYTRLGCGRHCDGVSIAPEPRCDPENVEFADVALRSMENSVCQQDFLLRNQSGLGITSTRARFLAGPHLLAESSTGQAKEPKTSRERDGQTFCKNPTK